MVKLIGMLLIANSLLSLIFGTFIDLKYGSTAEITGNVISNILTQPPVLVNFYDYLWGVAFSYSMISFVIGVVFLFRI
ncbi:hypothetical protein HYX04_02165 [Candidatus Woesearchaeota archaeon]|nr:hypothetical protein [Candidatus Woesearchaeota archaeon]